MTVSKYAYMRQDKDGHSNSNRRRVQLHRIDLTLVKVIMTEAYNLVENSVLADGTDVFLLRSYAGPGATASAAFLLPSHFDGASNVWFLDGRILMKRSYAQLSISIEKERTKRRWQLRQASRTASLISSCKVEKSMLAGLNTRRFALYQESQRICTSCF